MALNQKERVHPLHFIHFEEKAVPEGNPRIDLQRAAARGVVCAAIRAAAGSCGRAAIRIDAVLIEVQVHRIALCQIRRVMVDEVECLDAELQCPPFRHVVVLEQGKVSVEVCWNLNVPMSRSPSRSPKCLAGVSGN